MNLQFDFVKFEEEYGICYEETVTESQLEEKEELEWEEPLKK